MDTTSLDYLKTISKVGEAEGILSVEVSSERHFCMSRDDEVETTCG